MNSNPSTHYNVIMCLVMSHVCLVRYTGLTVKQLHESNNLYRYPLTPQHSMLWVSLVLKQSPNMNLNVICTCAVAVLEVAAGPYSMLWKISYTVLVLLTAIIRRNHCGSRSRRRCAWSFLDGVRRNTKRESWQKGNSSVTPTLKETC